MAASWDCNCACLRIWRVAAQTATTGLQQQTGPSEAEVVAEALDLMHPLVQDRHDADVAVAEPAPLDDVALMPDAEPAEGKRPRDRRRVVRGKRGQVGVESGGGGKIKKKKKKN